MFKIYDISMSIHDQMQVYKNKASKRPEIRVMHDFSVGRVYESRISLDAHTGTHLDAPLHMLENGDTIETIPLERLVSTARVIDLTHVEESIGRGDLEPHALQTGEWVLLKTRNSFSEEFDYGFVYLREDGAEYLAERMIKGVGIDGLGIERSQEGHPTHKALFSRQILIVEGLRLKDVPPGTYMLVVAPLKLKGIEAAPARAFLLGN
ncbi:cyclase family protein [Ferviditalea candida]|uniref:Cyclase family protein n=1 Tax=Ferviditalea candida TaxID=3108399 RepID=A0ABU5ZKS4_9BACL|nr:cyclase family protein [Paenibacillaceae bacterium T2]